MADPNPITTALLAAMMHSTEPMVLSDPHAPDHPMIAVNPAFERLTLYSAAECVGRNCRFLQGDGTDRTTPKRIRQCIAARHASIEWIVNYKRDGSQFWNLLFISPVWDRERNLLHYFGNQRDITLGRARDVGDFSFGRAEMSPDVEAEFHRLLLDILEHNTPGDDPARSIEAIVETARRVTEITTRLQPAPWSPD